MALHQIHLYLGTSAHSASCPACLSSSHPSSPFSISSFPPRTLPDPLRQSWLPPLFPTHSLVTEAHLDSGGRKVPKLVESFSAALPERLQGSLALIMTVDPSDHMQELWNQALWFRSHAQPNSSVLSHLYNSDKTVPSSSGLLQEFNEKMTWKAMCSMWF